MIDWIILNDEAQLSSIASGEGDSLIFKHSTRCPVSMMAKRNFESEADALPKGVPVYFLDLIRYRTVSAGVAEVFQITHESPQLLLIRNGQCIFTSSHAEINAPDVAKELLA